MLPPAIAYSTSQWAQFKSINFTFSNTKRVRNCRKRKKSESIRALVGTHKILYIITCTSSPLTSYTIHTWMLRQAYYIKTMAKNFDFITKYSRNIFVYNKFCFYFLFSATIQQSQKSKQNHTNQATHLLMAMSWPKQRPIRLWWLPRNPPERTKFRVSVIHIRWLSPAEIIAFLRWNWPPPSSIIAIANLNRCHRRCSKNYKFIHRLSTRPMCCHVAEAHLYHVQNQLQLMVFIMCCKRARIHPNPVSIWAHRAAI